MNTLNFSRRGFEISTGLSIACLWNIDTSAVSIAVLVASLGIKGMMPCCYCISSRISVGFAFVFHFDCVVSSSDF